VNVLVLQVFVSLMLVLGAVLLFAYSVRHRDHEHADRLSLIPLEDDGAPQAPDASEPRQSDSTR
jgi:hypothetical protein